MSNKIASKYLEQKFGDLLGGTDKFTIILDFSTILSIIKKLSKQKALKTYKILRSTIIKPDTRIGKCAIFSNIHGIVTEIDTIQGLNMFQ